MLTVKELQQLFLENKEQKLSGRYIHNEHILPLLNVLKSNLKIEEIGKSVLKKPLFCIKIGKGPKRVLMWSQMHGNESTTTKAVFDLINTLISDSNGELKTIFDTCTICIIPILNPDGALTYTRFNAKNIDLNRDAKDLTQPESLVLNAVFKQFKPDYCFNLHGQRTIFSAGNTNNPATVSFLSPAQDENRTITESRKVSMEIIASMNKVLQKQIPNQVGVYDDSFNINCVGDTFQSHNVPTILFEAGHYPNDYQREKTREFIYQSLLVALVYISNNQVTGSKYEGYLNIQENKKRFFDIILRNAKWNGNTTDIAIQFEEVLENNKIKFVKRLKKFGNLNEYFGHEDVNLGKKEVIIKNLSESEGIEIDIVEKN